MANDVFQSFRAFIQSQGTFSVDTWNMLEPILEKRAIAKGESTLKEGEVCKFIDYVVTGSFRACHNKDGEEITTAFYTEGACVTDMKSLSHQIPSKLTITANETSLVIRLYKEKLIALYDQSGELQSLGRSILESMVINESGWKEMYTTHDPAGRYEFLLGKAPDIILRFSLQHVASFLGIRRETLSRIRGKQKM